MHRPLKESCTLQLLNFKMIDPYVVNRAFWRSCSFMLGAVMQRTFKDDAGMFLHSFPPPNSKFFDRLKIYTEINFIIILLFSKIW